MNVEKVQLEAQKAYWEDVAWNVPNNRIRYCIDGSTVYLVVRNCMIALFDKSKLTLHNFTNRDDKFTVAMKTVERVMKEANEPAYVEAVEKTGRAKYVRIGNEHCKVYLAEPLVKLFGPLKRLSFEVSRPLSPVVIREKGTLLGILAPIRLPKGN